jgi:hypothetical protein
VSISERPASIEDRAVPGHWEGDLIGGSRNSYVATLVERHSRYVMLVKVANKDTESVVSALIKQSQRLPGELYRSLTWDRGKELADHQRLTLATEVEVYFCDPRSPWQRGSNESTNRLLRQYLPRDTDLSLHSQAKLSAIARQLNERPRKTLLYQTPADKFADVLQRSVEPDARSGPSPKIGRDGHGRADRSREQTWEVAAWRELRSASACASISRHHDIRANWAESLRPTTRCAPHQFRTRNDLIKSQRTHSISDENATRSTILTFILPLITVWLFESCRAHHRQSLRTSQSRTSICSDFSGLGESRSDKTGSVNKRSAHC